MAFLHGFGFGLASTTSGIEVHTWNGAGASRNATGGRCAQGSLKILSPATGVRTGVCSQFRSAAPSWVYACFYLVVTTRPNVNTTIACLKTGISMANSTGMELAIELKTDGTLQLARYDSSLIRTAVGSPSAALANGTLYRIEMQEDQTNATNTLEGKIDGTVFATTAVAMAGATTSLALGANLNAETCTTGQWEISDVVIHDATGSTQNTYPGDGALAYLWPDAAGDFAEGALGGSSPAATGWQSVNENPPDDGVTFWELQTDSSASSGNADRLDVSVGAFPAASNTPVSVEWVAVGARVKPLTNAVCSWVPRVKSQASGTVAEGTTASITGTAWGTHDDTSNAQQYKLCRTTDPQTAGAWGVDPSAWQIGARAPDALPNVDITSLWALVRHVPGAGAVQDTPELRGRQQIHQLLAF